MRAFAIILVLGLALSTQALNSQRKLIPRCTDDNKQLMKGQVTVTEVYESCTVATQSVQQSCKANDNLKLQESVASVQVYVIQLKTIVETFDGRHAITHKTTVVAIFATYFSMINTISKTKDKKQLCQNQLVQINEAFLSISSVYIAMGIDLRSEFKDDSEYNEDAFKQLDLSPPFVQNEATPSGVHEKGASLSDVHDKDSDASYDSQESLQEKGAVPPSVQEKDAASSDDQEELSE